MTDFFLCVVVNAPRGYGKTTQAPFMAMECADMWRAAHSAKTDGRYKDPRSSCKFIVVVGSPNAAISLQEYYRKMYPSMRIGVAKDDLGLCKDDFVGTMQGQTEKMCRNGFLGTVFIDHADFSVETVNVIHLLNVCGDGLQRNSNRDVTGLRRIGSVIPLTTAGREEAIRELAGRFADQNGFSSHTIDGRGSDAPYVISSCIFDASQLELCRELRQSKDGEWDMLETTKNISRAIGNLFPAIVNFPDFCLWERMGPADSMVPHVANCKTELLKMYGAVSTLASTEVNGLTSGRFPSMLIICAAPEQATAMASAVYSCPQSFMCKTGNVFSCAGTKLVKDANENSIMWTVERLSVGVNEESTTNLNRLNPMNRKFRGIFDHDVYTGKLIVATLETAVKLNIPNLAFVLCTADVTRYEFFKLNGLSEPYDRFFDKYDLEEMRSRVNVEGCFVVANSDRQVVMSLNDDERMTRNLQNRYTLLNYLDTWIVSDGIEEYEVGPQGTFYHKNGKVVPAAYPSKAKSNNMNDACHIMGLLEQRDGRYIPTLDTVFLMRVFPFLPIEFSKVVVMGVKLGVAKQAIVVAAFFLTNDRLSQQAAGGKPGHLQYISFVPDEDERQKIPHSNHASHAESSHHLRQFRGKIPLDDENATSFRLARNYVNKILHNCIIGSRNVDPHMRWWIIKTWSNTRLIQRGRRQISPNVQ